KSSTSSSSSSSSGTSSSSSMSGSGGAGGGSASDAGGATAAGGKPVLRSFTYVVMPHTPLRPVATKAAEPAKKQIDPQQQKGGRGRGGRGGMGSMEEEKPGSTRIVSILPQGSQVKAGDVVVELDKSTF